MKINLDQKEIQDALVEFITNQGIDISGKEVSVKMTASRGPAGHTAEIEIGAPGTPDKKPAKGAKAKKADDTKADDQAISFDFQD